MLLAESLYSATATEPSLPAAYSPMFTRTMRRAWYFMSTMSDVAVAALVIACGLMRPTTASCSESLGW